MLLLRMQAIKADLLHCRCMQACIRLAGKYNKYKTGCKGGMQ